MKLPQLAIKHHQFTIVIIALLVLSGIVSYRTMPRSEDPAVQPAGSSIIMIYPGASPADLERLCINPVEEALNELDDVRFLTGTAEDGLAVVDVEFFPGTDADEKFTDVTQKINSIREKLPEKLHLLEIIKWTISDVYIYQISVQSADASFRELEMEAERLKTELERISGIKKVDLWAYPEQEVHISIDLGKMAAYRLTLDYIMGAILDANANIPGGAVDAGTRRLTIKTSGTLKSLDEIRHTPIHALGGKSIYIKDIAEVKYSYADETHRARINGKRAIWITANQKTGTNIFNIRDAAKPIIKKWKDNLPADLSSTIVFNQSESVEKRVTGFFSNLFQGVLLVGAIIFLAVGYRAAFIVMLAIPISNFIGITAIHQSGYGLEQMSIAGLVIALGLLVDNAIVVTENISRYLRMGLSRREAAIKGTTEVGWAIASATATTVLAFIPIIFMQDITGDFIRSMPLTVVFTLLASLLISLTLTPLLSSKFLKIKEAVKTAKSQNKLQGFIEKRYRPLLKKALSKPGRVVAMVLVVFAGSLALFPLIGVTFFPKADKPLFFIQILLPPGSAMDETDRAALEVESWLKEESSVRHVAVNIGHGNPRIYYNVHTQRNATHYAHLFVSLKINNQDEMRELMGRLRHHAEDMPGVRVEIKELEQGPGTIAPIALRIIGPNLDILKDLSAQVADIIKIHDGTVNINDPLAFSKSDIAVEINRDKAARYGVALSEIDKTVRAAMTGLSIDTFQDESGKDYDIVVRMPFTHRPAISDFDRIYVASRNGTSVPLKQLAALKLTPSPSGITHFQMKRAVTVTSDVLPGSNVRQITGDITTQIKALNWPRDYELYIAGEMESQGSSFGSMQQAIIIAIIAIFAVLVLQFRSYIQPLIVFSAIPLAIIGAILGLLLSGNSFSFTAFIGLTSLVGIVVNNAIILVDYSNQLRKEGLSIKDALQQAGETRFTPIILTTATTIGGLLPLTLQGGSLWAPMGWTIIGGLLFSTILTLVIVPVLYRLFTKESMGI
ncbi:efflux RND transporter permease subunit [bacterium]|nr:efflux RND transporter permease subunit [bacterium]